MAAGKCPPRSRGQPAPRPGCGSRGAAAGVALGGLARPVLVVERDPCVTKISAHISKKGGACRCFEWVE